MAKKSSAPAAKKKTAPAKSTKVAKAPTKAVTKPAAKPVKASPKAVPVKNATKGAGKKVSPIKSSKPVKEVAKSSKEKAKPVAPVKATPAAKGPKTKEAPSVAPKKALKIVSEIVEENAQPAVDTKATAKVTKSNLLQKAAEPKVAAPKKEKKKSEKVLKAEKLAFEEGVKWQDLKERYKAVKAPGYSIGGQFEAKSPLQHKVFGWGFILSNEYDRLEVLFEDGKKMLISNRKL